ncbi:MAG: 30S ribosomal protein S15 [bacterium]
MTMDKTQKTEIINKFRTGEGDTGSPEVQVAILSERINHLTGHFSTHAKDHASRRGLLKMVGRRRKLLSYLKEHKEESYKSLIKELGIRK